MAVKQILTTDTLESGFRSKYNETINEIITGYEFPQSGSNPANGYLLRLKKFGGAYIDVNLQQFYYTKQQISTLLSQLAGSPYVGNWNDVDAAAGKYISTIVTDYNGSFWRANATTNQDDIPGVSNKWDNILKPILPIWDNTEIYYKDQTVRKLIDGVYYQFASQTNNNITQPDLTAGIAPWTQSGDYIGNWVSGPYLIGQSVTRSGSIYTALTNNSNDPATHPTDWQSLGTDRGLFDPDYVGGYLDTDAVIDGNSLSYASNVTANSYPLDQASTMEWDVIGSAVKAAVVSFPAGTALPITLSSFQTLYSRFGDYPRFEVMVNSGANKGLDITAQATVNKGASIPPSTIYINADDDGTGHLQDDILIIIKP